MITSTGDQNYVFVFVFYPGFYVKKINNTNNTFLFLILLNMQGPYSIFYKAHVFSHITNNISAKPETSTLPTSSHQPRHKYMCWS